MLPPAMTDAADMKTVRLSSLPLDEVRVDKLLQGWGAELAEFKKAGAVTIAAHDAALKASGLPEGEYGRLTAMARDFAGIAVTERHLRKRVGELKGSNGSPEKIERAEKHLRTTDARRQLASKFGVASIQALEQREDDLVRLHEELGRYLR